jgi:hypothetical protein
MTIILTLLAAHRSELMSYVREYSDVWNSLCDAVKVTSKYLPLEEIVYAVTCDKSGAEVLLFTAMKHCPDAVDAIKAAIMAAQALLH